MKLAMISLCLFVLSSNVSCLSPDEQIGVHLYPINVLNFFDIRGLVSENQPQEL